MKFNVLIVDDEIGMRILLRKIIEKIDEFNIIDEVDSGELAQSFQHLKKSIDLVFLDVEMTGLNGVETARAISNIKPNIKIIFATAYGEYMGFAFEVYAYDYLLKPFKIQRVFKTLERFKNEFKNKKNLEEKNKKIMIKSKDINIIIDENEILFIEREGKETIIITEKEKYRTNTSLIELEDKLSEKIFIRAHKSYIINKNKIHEISSYGRWTYIIKFKNIKDNALITQRKYEEIKELFK